MKSDHAPAGEADVPANISERRTSLTSGPVTSTLLVFALPIMGSTILQSLNGSINAIWIGRFLGEDALVASANGNLLMFLMMAFVFGLAMSSTIVIGQAVGRRDLDWARRALGTAIGAFLAVLVPITALGWLLAPRLLGLLATPDGSLDLAVNYLRAIFLSLPPAMLMTIVLQAMRGAGDAMTPCWFLVLSALLDAILNPILILGLGPAPELGIAGSGIATTIANLVSLIVMIGYVYARDLPLRLRGAELGYLRPNPILLGLMVRMGVPMGLQMIVTASSALVMLALINRQGIIVTAAYSAMQQLWTYVQMPAISLGAASSAMVAQNIGAGNWARVGRIARAALWLNFLFTNLLVILLTLIDTAALSLFLGTDSPALPIGRHIHRLATWGFFFSGISMVLFGAVRGNGTVILPLIVLVVTMYPLRIGFAVMAEPWLGEDALWLSFPISSVAGAAMAAILYLEGSWRKRGLTRALPGEDECVEEGLAGSEPGGSMHPRG